MAADAIGQNGQRLLFLLKLFGLLNEHNGFYNHLIFIILFLEGCGGGG